MSLFTAAWVEAKPGCGATGSFWTREQEGVGFTAASGLRSNGATGVYHLGNRRSRKPFCLDDHFLPRSVSMAAASRAKCVGRALLIFSPYHRWRKRKLTGGKSLRKTEAVAFCVAR